MARWSGSQLSDCSEDSFISKFLLKCVNLLINCKHLTKNILMLFIRNNCMLYLTH